MSWQQPVRRQGRAVAAGFNLFARQRIAEPQDERTIADAAGKPTR